MQHHRIFKPLLIGLCLVLLVAGGLFTIVGSGGGGDSRTPPGAIQAFLNTAIRCIYGGTYAQVTIGGQVMTASRGGLSGCKFLAPATYNATIRIAGHPSCGALVFRNVSLTIQDLYTLRLNLVRLNYLGGGRYSLTYSTSQATPGACNPAKIDGELGTEGTDLEEFTVESEPVLEELGSGWI